MEAFLVFLRIIDPRALWALIYILFNASAYIYIRCTGYLMGDGDGRPVHDPDLLLLVFIALNLFINFVVDLLRSHPAQART